MAQLGMATAGAVIGFIATGGNPQGAQVGWMIGSIAGGLLFPPKGPHVEGPRLNDRTVQLATYGTPIPRCYGVFRVAGALIYAQPIEEVKTDQEVGGKGGPTGTQTTYTYFGTFAIALAQGPIAGIGRVWADGKLIYGPEGALEADATDMLMRAKIEWFAAGGAAALANLYPTPTVYLGTETQAPDPTIQGDKGIANTPAFKGTAYLVYSRLPLANFGNRIPNITVEVIADGEAALAFGTPEVAWEQPTLPTGEGSESQPERSDRYRTLSTMPDKWGQTYWTSFNYEDSGLMLTRAGAVGWYYGRDEMVALAATLGVTVAPDADTLVSVGVVCGGEYLVAVWASGTFDTNKNVLLLAPTEGGAPTALGFCFYTGAQSAPPYSDTYTVTQMGLGRATDAICIVGAAGVLNTGVSILPPPSDLLADRFSGGWNATTYGATMALSTTPYRVPTLVSYLASPWNNYQGAESENGVWMAGEFVNGSDPLNVDVTTWLYGTVYDQYGTGAESALRWEFSIWNTYADHIREEHWTGSAFASRTLAAATDASAALGMPWNQQRLNIDGTSSGIANMPYHHAVGFSPILPASPEGGWLLLFTQPVGGSNASYGVPAGTFRAYVRVRAYLWTPLTGTYSLLDTSEAIVWEGTKSTYGDVDNSYAVAMYEPNHGNGIYVYSTLNPQFVKSSLGVGTGSFAADLGEIVADLSMAAGLEAGQIDVTDLTGTVVRGYLVGRETTARAAIEPLMGTYLFDGAESDGKLKFRFRGGTSALTLDEDELGASGGGAAGTLVAERRRQDIELPRSVTLRYVSQALEYQPGSATFQRISPAFRAGDPVSAELPLVMDDTEAKERAGKMLGEAWLTRTNFRFALPPSRIALDPTDVVTLEYGTNSVSVMLLKVDFGADGVLSCEAHSTDAITYLAPPAESAVIPSTGQSIASIQAVTLALLDIPLLRDQDDTPGFYVAAKGTDSTWGGGAVYRAADGSTDYGLFLATPAGAVIGTTADALADGPTVVFDTASDVTVTVPAGTVLESRTQLEVLAGNNIALVGDELVGFTTAVQNSSTSWTLSGLLRGVQGTDWATTTHAIGDRFVLLRTNGSVLPASVSLGELNVSKDYKGVSVGGLVEDATAQAFAPTFERLKPLSPVHVAGTRDGSNNLSLTWVRRARVGGDWVDFTETPLDEPVEAYEVDVILGSVVARTLSASTAAASYSAAEQTADGTTPGDPVSVVVYQISTRVGRGHGRAATV